jgi:hypothetical protein
MALDDDEIAGSGAEGFLRLCHGDLLSNYRERARLRAARHRGFP